MMIHTNEGNRMVMKKAEEELSEFSFILNESDFGWSWDVNPDAVKIIEENGTWIWMIKNPYFDTSSNK